MPIGVVGLMGVTSVRAMARRHLLKGAKAVWSNGSEVEDSPLLSLLCSTLRHGVIHHGEARRRGREVMS